MFGRAKSNDSWQERYREVVAEIEQKEGAWSELEGVLRKAASRLAIAAMGQSVRVDDALDELRSELAAGTNISTVEYLLEELVAALSALEEKHRQTGVVSDGPASADSAADGLAALLERLELPLRVKTDFTADYERTSGSDRERVLTQLALQVNSLIAQSAEATPYYDVPDTAGLITVLLSRMRAIPAVGDAVQSVENRVRNGAKDEDWADVLTALADTVAQVVSSLQAEKTELKEFLAQITKQLGDFEHWTSWAEDEVKGRRDDSRALEENVGQQVHGLHEDMAESSDVAELKTKVQSRLDAVAEQLQQFREKDEVRLAEAEKHNAELRQEVEGLRAATTELTELCGNQQSQLMRDTLTKVHSRYAYEIRLQEEFQRWQRHGQALSYAIWDIDFFKAVNDTYGHNAGDRLLQMVAGSLAKNTRSEDFLARIGGEEFAMLLPATELDAALKLADKLRSIIEATAFHYKGTPERVTISCGVTEFREGDTPVTVYSRADKALYTAKEQGRNRCCSL